MWALLLLSLAQPTAPQPSVDTIALAPTPLKLSDWAQLKLRVTLGSEWDSNAKRAIPNNQQNPLPNASRPDDVVQDGLARLLIDVGANLKLHERHRVRLGYVLGAKRFFTQDTEDLLVHDLRLSSIHGFTRWLSASVQGTLRASRIRSGRRDYNLGLATGVLSFRLHQTLDLNLNGGFNYFHFPIETHFDYLGPRAGGGLAWRPIRGLSVNAELNHVWRDYNSNALVRTQIIYVDDPSTPGVDESLLNNDPRNNFDATFCDTAPTPYVVRICEPIERKDREVQVSAGVVYRGGFIVGGQYLLRIQRSTSALERIDRHRVSAFATVGLPYGITVNAIGALQFNNGLSVTDSEFLAEDDENQNSLQAGVRYELFDNVTIELRYALFANQFSTNDISFIRQTVYLGLGYRAKT